MTREDLQAKTFIEVCEVCVDQHQALLELTECLSDYVDRVERLEAVLRQHGLLEQVTRH